MKRILLHKLSVIGILLPAILLAGAWPARGTAGPRRAQLSRIGAGAGGAALVPSAGSLVHGVNFMVKTVLDESFCLETDVDVSATPSVHIAPCTGRANQRWTFTDGEDGSSVIVGDRALCLQVERSAEPEKLGIGTCDYHTDQRFTVTPAGLIKERRSDDCLSINWPFVNGNAILVEECRDQLAAEQTWRLAM